MRTIKFRAWQKLGKRMIVIFDSTTQTEWFIPNMKNGDYEYMQFTGLEDKNGKEIYEEDIIKLGSNVFVVQWSDSRAGWMAFSEAEMGTGLAQGYRNSMEVIGNIYENPELL